LIVTSGGGSSATTPAKAGRKTPMKCLKCRKITDEVDHHGLCEECDGKERRAKPVRFKRSQFRYTRRVRRYG
jgi:hypothetical protein